VAGSRATTGLAGALGATLRMAWQAQRAPCIALVALAAAGGAAPIAAAWLLRAILDALAARHGNESFVLVAAALGVAGSLPAVLSRFSMYLSAQSSRAVQRESTDRLFAAVTDLPGLRTLENPAFQDTLRYAQQAGASGPGVVLSGILGIAESAVTLIGFLVTLLLLSPVLATVLIAVVLPALALEQRAARAQVAVMRGLTPAERRQFFYASLLTDRIAAKEIRLFGLSAFFRSRMLAELDEVQRRSAQSQRRVMRADVALAALGAAVTVGGLVWMVSAAAAGHMTLGDVAILVAALAAANGTLSGIVTGWALTYSSLLSFQSYRQVLAVPADLAVTAYPEPVLALQRGIEIDDVWFRYGTDKPWVLRGVSCFIPQGETLALVGRNGSGKSTLVKLLCRFYDPDRGRILWDGIDLRDMDPAELRDRMSVVFQDYMTYDLTASDNIAVGDLRTASEDLVREAARQAGIHDTLASLPKGYETLLTRTYIDNADKENPETGLVLSGGQWQRVALARAFARTGRDLIIMDEPSAGLDAEAEHDLHQRLVQTRSDRTAVLISHRLNTIRDADRIIVLSGGVVAEQGNHDYLVAHRGTYARLYSLQARGYATAKASMGAGID
jgi:ATP-binding cassette, subfamily B, bacterial